MKTHIVAISMMIMLGFVQILQTEALIPCTITCGLKCLISSLPYGLCWVPCVIKCEIIPGALDCVKGCGVNKTVTIDIDAAGKVSNVVDSCLQKCSKLQQ
ncbi:uncharacterized protein HKW66_Vig0142130 [Vigna angularis]|uniref:Uncharacterized protein n=1 Tax=Phaseolus angularis TaxID=3914 RepID=A0A8T0KDI8_PHAAN|nr:uncharacterized protein HKW66_Vig0142130 [Vigna angularis]